MAPRAGRSFRGRGLHDDAGGGDPHLLPVRGPRLRRRASIARGGAAADRQGRDPAHGLLSRRREGPSREGPGPSPRGRRGDAELRDAVVGVRLARFRGAPRLPGDAGCLSTVGLSRRGGAAAVVLLGAGSLRLGERGDEEGAWAATPLSCGVAEVRAERGAGRGSRRRGRGRVTTAGGADHRSGTAPGMWGDCLIPTGECQKQYHSHIRGSVLILEEDIVADGVAPRVRCLECQAWRRRGSNAHRAYSWARAGGEGE